MLCQAFEVRVTAAAEADLRAIHSYLKEHGSAAIASSLRAEMLERIEALEQFPFRGSIPREVAGRGLADVRQLISTPYRIIYRISGTIVFIMMVVDGRRDVQEILRRRLLRAPPAS